MQNYNNILRNIEKKLITDTKKLTEFTKFVESLEEYNKLVTSLKDDISLKKQNFVTIENETAKTNAIENIALLYKEYKKLDELVIKSNTIKELHLFFEKFRTHRTYFLNKELLERFLSKFLNNFSEDFNFKTEFAGQLNLTEFATKVEGKKDVSGVKIKYEKIPKAVNLSYENKLKKFIIESGNLKLLFRENYILEIFSNSNMIHKIDKIAKENNINFE
jgi:hypothetical protein